MSILIKIFLAWWAYNLLKRMLRGKAPDPMAGRLIHRNPLSTVQPTYPAWTEKESSLWI
jgi:hypothetical protein